MIETQGLTKRYGELVAVDNLTFSVQPGEVLGFLGPNGAGKSTTMKMITGFISPSSGAVRVMGHDVEHEPVQSKATIGYLPEGAPTYGEMTPLQFLHFVAEIRGLNGATRQRRMDYVIERLQLGTVLTQSIETLSKGFKRRVGLAQAVLHDPQVLILDEPTDGLDPNQKHEVRGLIRDMAQDKIIIISTHILEEVDAVCSRAIIIADGRLLADDTPSGLARRSRFHNAVSLRLQDPSQLDAARQAITALAGVSEISVNDDGDGLIAFPAEGRVILADIHALLSRGGWAPLDLHLESGRLDQVFRDITGGKLQ